MRYLEASTNDIPIELVPFPTTDKRSAHHQTVFSGTLRRTNRHSFGLRTVYPCSQIISRESCVHVLNDICARS